MGDGQAEESRNTRTSGRPEEQTDKAHAQAEDLRSRRTSGISDLQTKCFYVDVGLSGMIHVKGAFVVARSFRSRICPEPELSLEDLPGTRALARGLGGPGRASA